jgi:hypothetical protein
MYPSSNTYLSTNMFPWIGRPSPRSIPRILLCAYIAVSGIQCGCSVVQNAWQRPLRSRATTSRMPARSSARNMLIWRLAGGKWPRWHRSKAWHSHRLPLTNSHMASARSRIAAISLGGPRLGLCDSVASIIGRSPRALAPKILGDSATSPGCNAIRICPSWKAAQTRPGHADRIHQQG